MSVHSAHDVRNTRASTWRDAAELEHEQRYAPSKSGSSTTLSTDSGSSERLVRRRSIGPVWCDHLDRSVSIMLSPKVAKPKPETNRRQTEAIPIPESLDANGLHRSQAWDFEASYDARQDRVRRRLGKNVQATQEYVRECEEAGLGGCQAQWRMGYEKVGACHRPHLPGGPFCSLHTCTALGRDGERCPNYVADPVRLANNGQPRVCRTGYHMENNLYDHLLYAEDLNKVIRAKEAEEAPMRDLEHLAHYAEISGESEPVDGYTIYTQLNGVPRNGVSRKPSALDLSAASRRPSFSAEPTPLWTGTSTSADSSKLRTPTTPLPCKDWPLYVLDAALLKARLDTASSKSPEPARGYDLGSVTSPCALRPSPVINHIVVPPVIAVMEKKNPGLSIEIVPVSGSMDSTMTPSPSPSSGVQTRRASLSPISIKPLLPTVEECEEGHPTPHLDSTAAPAPAISASPLAISPAHSTNMLCISPRPSSRPHLTVDTAHARSPASAVLSTSPCSATSQLQLVLGRAKRAHARSVSIDGTSFASQSQQSISSDLQSTQASSNDSSAVQIILPRMNVAGSEEVTSVKERLAARKGKGKGPTDGKNMARIMRGRLGDGFMHRSAWGRHQQMDEDLLALEAK